MSRPEMVIFVLPGSGLIMGIEKAEVEDAMAELASMTADAREKAINQVCQSIQTVLIKRETGFVTTEEEDDMFPSDCAVFIAHELIWGEGEQLLVKEPGDDALIANGTFASRYGGKDESPGSQKD